MTEVKKIAHNTAIQIIGKIITVALGLLAFGLIARSLGQEGFGFYTTVYGFLAVFSILVDLGLQMTTTKIISEPGVDQNKILSNALTIRLLSAVIFLGLAPLAVLFFPYPTVIKVGVAVAAIGFVFVSLTNTLTSLFQQKLAMLQAASADVIAKIIFVGLLILVLNANLGLLGIIGATVIDSFFSFFILFWFAKKYVVIKPSFEWAVWRKILLTTWPIALTIALNLIYFKGDIVIMSVLRPQTEVGLYGAPYKILEVLINTAYIFLGLILPLLAASAAAKNWQRFKHITQGVFDVMIAIAIPLIVGGLFLGRQILVFMAGDEFALSGEIFKILLLATGTIFIAALFGYAVVALDEQKRMIKFYLFNAIVSIALYFWLIPIYSFWAAAWITVGSEAFILLTAWYVVARKISYLPNLTIVWKSLIASIVMAVPIYYLLPYNFLIPLLAGSFVYAVVMLGLKSFDQKLIKEIFNFG